MSREDEEPPMGVDRDQQASPKSDSGQGEHVGHSEHARPRKRTRRACDKCSASRTRCNGECPCRRCEDYGYICRYNREIKKRGRVPTSLAAGGHSAGSSHRSTSQLAEDLPNGNSPSPAIASSNISAQPNYTQQEDTGLPSISGIQPTDDSGNHPVHDSQPVYHPDLQHHDAGQPPSTHHSVLPRPFSSPNGYPPHGHLPISSILEPSAEQSHYFPQPYQSPASIPAVSGSEPSIGYPSPSNGFHSHQHPAPSLHGRGSFGASMVHRNARSSFSGSVGREGFLPELQPMDSQFKPTSAGCKYKFLDPVLPYLRDIIPASVAADLLDVYLTEPGSSLFRCASPYILTRVFRKKSILHETHPRPTSPALLAAILWCTAQTADIVHLHVPGSRSRVVCALYELATSLISERDPDRWRRSHTGLRAETDQLPSHFPFSSAVPTTTAANEPAGVIDDVLTLVLLSIAVSGGDFKSDCFKWWSKLTRLTISMKLNREDERCSATVTPCANPLCSCRKDQGDDSLAAMEAKEERRRVFWLIYCLDRHLALSFNTVLDIPDSYCQVYAPLPEEMWENLDSIPLSDLERRTIGPPTTVSGTGFFEYFLPLMAILGDIIEVHHRRQHPRLGHLDDSAAITSISALLSQCEQSLNLLAREADTTPALSSTGPSIQNLMNDNPPAPTPPTKSHTRTLLVLSYSTLILHVLHVLLHGKWDAISMLDNHPPDPDWITSPRFHACASHAISASTAVSSILQLDPELTFMPYLFGIYLLHGSFILLLFADRMPQLGSNEGVERACETIIRAHEVCVVTLTTEFQKNFRKVLRSTLYSVRDGGDGGAREWEERKARRRALSLYRWTPGARGLAL